MVVNKKQRRQLLHYLGPLELRILEAVWKHGPSTVADVVDALKAEDDRSLAYNTVMTTMTRMAEKSYFTRAREGRAFRYSAPTLDGFLQARAGEVIGETLDRLGENAVAGFGDALSGMTPSRRRALLDRLAAADDE